MNIVSEIKELQNGKKVLFVEGKPFQTYGMQLRLDRYRNNANKGNEDLCGLFKAARNLYVNTVQVVVTWKEVEPREGIYDFANIEFAISQCMANGLKMEIVWFGSNVCGSGWDNFTPEWIINDKIRFYRIVDQNGGELAADYIHPMDGRKYTLCVENDELLYCEERIINRMLKFIMNIDKCNSVIGFQVENEPSIVQHNPQGNMTDRCHCSKCNDLYESGEYGNSLDFSKERLAVYLNKVASFVKNSSLKIMTRVNFICWYWDIDEDVGFMRRYAPMVDFNGYDNYGCTLEKQYEILNMDMKCEGNVPHISEAAGDEKNQRERILGTICADAVGYEVYQLAPATEMEDNCILNADLTYKDNRAEDIKKTFRLLSDVMPKIASRRSDYDIFYFNTGYGCEKIYSNNLKIMEMAVEYSTDDSGIGIAFNDNEWLVLISSNRGIFKAPSDISAIAEFGRYDGNGAWNTDCRKTMKIENGRIIVDIEDCAVRLKVF